MLYCRYLRCGDPRSPGPWSSATVHSDYVTTTMTCVVKKWRVKLIFQGTYRLSGTGVIEI